MVIYEQKNIHLETDFDNTKNNLPVVSWVIAMWLKPKLLVNNFIRCEVETQGDTSLILNTSYHYRQRNPKWL